MKDVNKPGSKPEAMQAPNPAQEMQALSVKPRGLFRRLSAGFDEAIESSRAPQKPRDPVVEAASDPKVTADDLALRRAKSVTPVRMIIPEGVIIEGSMTSGSETEINGRIEGNVTVEGRLFLGPSALITGNVRAVICRVDGLVDGKVEVSQELDLGKSGRINGDVVSGKSVTLSGQVFGNIATGGLLSLVSTAQLTGDIRVRSLVIEEGATFNGRCSMRPPAEQKDKK